ncbi:hypothetical protein FA95DRAFT_209696 [Auriscalpium vulgare]|uniref:Uncharacterized protein n=1 Tax=Auriscalpium vulgare TaxID=40419 RepID=A0ACB8RLW3_9AGAM|nr:hypothetical protein FA95DRAFT_209696 [Auriscalpium vulgare]
MVSNPARSTESDIVKADPTTILGKFLVGYQGWFTCHGDGEPVGPGHHGWQHWCTYPIADGGNINTDYWPDMSMYEGDELFPAPGFKHLNGEQAYLFSSRHPRTVQKHFRWMAENGVDGAFLQRFVGAVEEKPGDMGGLNIRDEVGKLVEQACEKEGRVYAIMYDAAKCKPKERLQEILEKDWKKLVNDKRILDSPNYLRHEGKPVIAVWGLSWADSDHTPETVRSIAKFLRDNTPGGAYLYAGIPNFWRTAEGDSLPNKDFLPAILESFDAISPWTVGAYPDEPGVDFHAQWRWGPDVDFLKKWEQDTGRHVEYIPTIHPGGTATNMSQGQWPMNGAPRCGGRFLWRQMYHTKRLGARTVYAAMWDEYDEGTQFLPAFVQQHQLPVDQTGRFKFIAYDVDGHVLPSDWYMRIAGYGAEALKGRYPLDEQFPEKVLQDWRHSHPRREQQGEASGSGSGSGEQGLAPAPVLA